ncbi:MAG: PIN domain-containing protein [Rhodospirillales bacterium]|nr:PIN domain-containing protein [Rhodospirillales bacterium]
MTGPVFVDTNILVYRHDTSETSKQTQADAWHSFLWRRRLGRLSFQVLQELYATLRQGRGPAFGPAVARDIVTNYLQWQPIRIDASVLRRAWVIEERFRLSWWDALIVAAAQAAECPILLTEDLQHGQDFNGVRVVNPFAVPQLTPLEVLEKP